MLAASQTENMIKMTSAFINRYQSVCTYHTNEWVDVETKKSCVRGGIQKIKVTKHIPFVNYSKSTPPINSPAPKIQKTFSKLLCVKATICYCQEDYNLFITTYTDMKLLLIIIGLQSVYRFSMIMKTLWCSMLMSWAYV